MPTPVNADFLMVPALDVSLIEQQLAQLERTLNSLGGAQTLGVAVQSFERATQAVEQLTRTVGQLGPQITQAFERAAQPIGSLSRRVAEQRLEIDRYADTLSKLRVSADASISPQLTSQIELIARAIERNNAGLSISAAGWANVRTAMQEVIAESQSLDRIAKAAIDADKTRTAQAERAFQAEGRYLKEAIADAERLDRVESARLLKLQEINEQLARFAALSNVENATASLQRLEAAAVTLQTPQ